MAGEPWLDYQAPASAGGDAPWAEYGGEVAPEEPAAPFDYSQHVAALIKSGADKQEIEDYVRGVGADPAQLQNLDAALQYKAQGGKGDIKVQMAPTGEVAATPQKTAGDSLGMGVRGVMAGLGGLVDVAAAPVNMLINALPGEQNMSTTPFRDAAGAAADWMGLATPQTGTERLVNAGVEGGAGGLATAGLGGLAAGAGGATGAVGAALSAAPVIDTAAGIGSGVAGEGANQMGGGPVTQLVAALLGGMGGGLAAAGGARLASRMTPKIAKVIDATPPEEVLTSAGALNENGRELAQRAGIPEEVLAESYGRVRQRQGATPTRNSQAGREAVRARQREPIQTTPANMGPDAPPSSPVPDLDAATQRIVDAVTERLGGRAAGTVDNGFPVSPDRQGTRFQEAASEGVPLTRGEAEQSFKIQNDEQSLYVAASAEGERARQFKTQRNDLITDAVTRFRERFGSTDGTPVERGQAVKDAISDLRDQGREGVNAMYRAAEEAGGEALPLETDALRNAATDILIDEAVPAPVKKTIEQEMARYGMVGEASPMNEVGITRVTLGDGSSVSFRGPPKQLTVANAEDFRKRINSLYMSDPTRASQALKTHIDDAVEAALEKAAAGEAGPVAEAYGAARQAHRNQRNTFHAKDIIQNVIDVRKGTSNTPVVMPERVISQVLGSGPAALTNINKVKGLLLAGANTGATQAWRGIQSQTLANIFSDAVNTQTQVVSGARLNTAIRKFGIDKLRVVLDPLEFNQLMKLQRIIGDATIPMSGTTNPSGTFTKLVNFMGKGALKYTGGIGDVAKQLALKARDLARTRKTLEGITSYDGTNSADIDRAAREFFDEYIKAASSGSIITAGLNAARPKEQ